MKRLLAVAVLASATIAAGASAQTGDCSTAAQVVLSMTPTSDNFASWAALHGCPGAASTFAQAIQLHHDSPDPDVRQSLYAYSTRFRDANVFNAALQVAGSSAATTDGRVLAFRILLALEVPRVTVSPTELTDASASDYCVPSFGSSEDGRPGAALPADFSAQIVATAKAASSSGDPALAAAASCARRLTLIAQPPEIRTALLQVSYVCRNLFKVHNDNDRAALLSFEVPGSTVVGDHGDISAAANGDTLWGTSSEETVKVYYRGRLSNVLLGSFANGHRSC